MTNRQNKPLQEGTAKRVLLNCFQWIHLQRLHDINQQPWYLKRDIYLWTTHLYSQRQQVTITYSFFLYIYISHLFVQHVQTEHQIVAIVLGWQVILRRHTNMFLLQLHNIQKCIVIYVQYMYFKEYLLGPSSSCKDHSPLWISSQVSNPFQNSQPACTEHETWVWKRQTLFEPSYK